MKKMQYFSKGDVIRTEPEKGYYGIAVVLSEGTRIEVAPGKMSYPLCHIAITPLLFQHPVSLDEVNRNDLQVLTFERNAKRSDGAAIHWNTETCVYIYTNRNKAGLTIIGNINPSEIYKEPLLYEPLKDRFFFCGDADNFLGREAYIASKLFQELCTKLGK